MFSLDNLNSDIVIGLQLILFKNQWFLYCGCADTFVGVAPAPTGPDTCGAAARRAEANQRSRRVIERGVVTDGFFYSMDEQNYSTSEMY